VNHVTHVIGSESQHRLGQMNLSTGFTRIVFVHFKTPIIYENDTCNNHCLKKENFSEDITKFL